jgi:LytTr DNA-binding domain
MSDRADENPEAWADRRPGGDGAAGRVTSGAPAGTSGVRMTAGAWALTVALLALVTFVNVATILDDAHRRGVRMQLALPLTLELTSAAAALASVILIAIAVRVALEPQAGWRRVAVLAIGSLAYSGVHIALMTLFRMTLFKAAGGDYDFSFSEVPYEYRKDLLGFVIIGVMFWLLSRRQVAPAPAPIASDAAPATFDIRDGASILRVATGEIVAARAAGNYVEFALEDGRRPLMRASLGAVETVLAPSGFVRTHRSWLVNAARVRALTAAGSGDFRLDLGCGLTAPLSRRYPAALARLKGDA